MRPLLLLAVLLALSATTSAQCFLEKLHQSEDPPGNFFGQAVALDGEWAVVGAPLGGSDDGPGRAYVFRRMGTAWAEDAMLSGDTGQMFGAGPGDQFGLSVAVQADRIVVGAPFEHEAGVLNAGAVYVFRRTGGSWVKEARLVSPTPEVQKIFGWSVDIDGDVLVVGEPVLIPVTPQRAQVFRWDGTAWVHEQTLQPPLFEAWKSFGWSVGVCGSLILVGSPHGNTKPSHGSVYAYEFGGIQWQYTETLLSTLSGNFDQFGFSLDILGSTALIGARQQSTAWIFQHGGTSWAERQQLLPNPTHSYDELGYSVSLSGSYALVGAPEVDSGPYTDAGSAYLFQLDGQTWEQLAWIQNPDPGDYDEFGLAVALDDGFLLIGTWGDDAPATDTGSASVFSAFDDVLLAFSESISLSAGGVQHLGLLAGAEDAGALYLLASTGSGTCPGLALGSVIVPANPDVFTTYSITHANQPPFAKTFGVLNIDGAAQAAIHLPAGMDPAFAGLQLHHAFIVIDPVTLGLRSASNAVALEFGS